MRHLHAPSYGLLASLTSPISESKAIRDFNCTNSMYVNGMYHQHTGEFEIALE